MWVYCCLSIFSCQLSVTTMVCVKRTHWLSHNHPIVLPLRNMSYDGWLAKRKVIVVTRLIPELMSVRMNSWLLWFNFTITKALMSHDNVTWWSQADNSHFLTLGLLCSRVIQAPNTKKHTDMCDSPCIMHLQNVLLNYSNLVFLLCI